MRRLLRTFLAALVSAALLTPNFPAITADSSKPMPPNPAAKTHSHTNRLAQEKSPYLLQHAHNPVDWFPWSDEAFERARRENKPIFLSIGYSTCHWCHVMERESFENEEIGAYLREHFISIKLDREERPDVDKIYMTYVQATTGSGGWPMTVFLTADRKPFYGGTYFPPQSKYGKPGFKDLLERVRELWSTRRDEVIASAEAMTEQIESHLVKEAAEKPKLNPDLLREAAMALERQLDPVNGGFRGAPKFPTPSLPSFLLIYGVRHDDRKLVEQMILTGDKMAAGGIRDQLGGGFARYSVDDKWLVPHFEKMLYDNAQLLDFYLDLYLVTGEQRLADVAHDILRYVLRDMTHPDGGFYSAEDADSEGYEGKFYAWTKAELRDLLTPEEFRVAVEYFGITEQGNFEDHSHPDPLPNQNVLSIDNPKLKDAERPLLASAKENMFAAQLKRIRPHRDDKVLASWNGLMLGPLARAAVVLNEPKYRAAAEKNLAFLKTKLWDADTKTLYHRWRDGERDTVQLLDAYAYLLQATITLYETTLDASKLEFALELADAMMKRFYDAEHGGFWQSLPDAKDLILRVKEDYDGAQPSGNAVAILALLKLGDITDQAKYREAAEKTLNFFADRVDRGPAGAGFFLQALDYWLDEPGRVVLTGEPTDERVKALIAAAHSVYQPTKVVLSNRGPVEEFAKTIKDQKEPEAYICTGKTCQPPTSEVGKLRELLGTRNK